MVKTIEALFDGTVFHAVHRHIAVVTKGDSMGTLRRRIGHMGLLVVMLSAGLLWTAQPVGAAGTPPIVRSFTAVALHAEGSTEPRLHITVTVDDPDGQVPLTIQSVIATGPDGRTFDLTNRYGYPDLGFRGGYFPVLGTPVPTGTYTLTVTDKDGNIATCPNGQPGPCTDDLNAFPSLLPPNITFPNHEQILTTTTPTFTWSPVANAGSIRVHICSANCVNGLYTGPFLSGTATQFTLPTGVLEPGRRYALRLDAFDTSTGSPTANIVARNTRNFSVAGPNVSLSLNKRDFRTGDLLTLRGNFRNDGLPTKFDLQLWVGLPTGGIEKLLDLDDLELPSIPGDVSLSVDIFKDVPLSGLPEGHYVFGIRLSRDKTDGIIAQSMIAFSFAP